MKIRESDYIIVGGGSAGCVLARRLGEDPDVEVLVLEAGIRDWSPYLHIPAGRIRMSARYDWAYPAEPDPSRQDKVENWESGKVLGGTSSINGMNWTRGDRSDYDGWAAAGCPGWDYQSVLPYFKRAETFEGGASEYRGDDGPMHVSFLRSHHPLVDAFIEAAQGAGHPFNPDYNGAHPAGVAHGQVSQRRGLRHNTARAYLAGTARQRNVRVITGAFARRVVIENGRAIGVEYERGRTTHMAHCAREVILSTGAIGSPKLLMLSGIGPGDALSSLGIDVRADLAGVGQHLKNHIGTIMLFEVDVPTLNRDFTAWNMVKHGLDLIVRGKGAATAAMGHTQLMGSHGGERLDYKFGFAPYGRFHHKETAARHRHKLRPETTTNAVTVRPSLLHPNARGSIALRSTDPRDPPIIDFTVAADPTDRAVYIGACRAAREVMAAEPMGSHVIREMKPGPEVQTDEEWMAAIPEHANAGKHTCGTCKMGTDDLAVVDPHLRVHGIGGLRVIDASIMPDVTSGGTNAPTIMIGERGADLVKGLLA